MLVRRVVLCGLAATMLSTSAIAAEGNYPNRPIRLLIPQATGGGSDTIGRYMAQRFAEELNQNLVVDNRPGAAGMLGAEMVKRATPDGYTMLLCAIDTITAPIVAQHKTLDGILYYNDGDWVDNRTALVEHESGELELLRWPEAAAVRRTAEVIALVS